MVFGPFGIAFHTFWAGLYLGPSSPSVTSLVRTSVRLGNQEKRGVQEGRLQENAFQRFKHLGLEVSLCIEDTGI